LQEAKIKNDKDKELANAEIKKNVRNKEIVKRFNNFRI